MNATSVTTVAKNLFRKEGTPKELIILNGESNILNLFIQYFREVEFFCVINVRLFSVQQETSVLQLKFNLDVFIVALDSSLAYSQTQQYRLCLFTNPLRATISIYIKTLVLRIKVYNSRMLSTLFRIYGPERNAVLHSKVYDKKSLNLVCLHLDRIDVM